MNSPCIEHLGGDQYRCVNLGITFPATVLPVRCGCSGGGFHVRDVGAPQPCPFGSMIRRLSNQALARLQLCREADCGDLRTNSGTAVCGRLASSSCKAVRRWMEFLESDDACPFWKGTSKKNET